MEYDIRDSEETARRQAAQNKLGIQKREEENSLYALVFGTEAGKKLLSKWEEEFIYTWIAQPHDTQIAVGLKQGQANFVIDIRNRLKQIAKGVEDGR